MEYFYREMRRRTPFEWRATRPAGGQWEISTHDNRNLRAADMLRPRPAAFHPAMRKPEAVLDLDASRFGENFGKRCARSGLATTRAQALCTRWPISVETPALVRFRAYQDAMPEGDAVFLNAH